ncbi:MAG: hypothetical protein A2X56_08640 [Nitrospirae bacterium GWC2_57_13]|jgi:hypothetical protein|nr:MAG: hypothetical protein A2072_08470 [Nitrospirae bacterium GWC1_57_7]OGW27996.1 MAG: hypothetical protein A2X56_08640 [Nitrospirae bacterium GWC2_57_13]OGW42846.1 MAG: hypothetical protein A2X57_01760 [Nitrospirae bacterium GWD2_57_8]HAS53144.1 hypothetical protein [Nitrospiraceae bacterium]
MRVKRSIQTVLTAAFLSFCLVKALSACAPSISSFDQTAYEYAISLKVDSLAMMNKATETYADHEKEVKDLMHQVEKAYEYAKGRRKNSIAATQWEILKDPDRNLLGGFIKYWSKNSKVDRVFIQETKGLVSDAFDVISGLESKKPKQ